MAKVRDVNRIPQAIMEMRRLGSRKVDVGIFSDAPKLVLIGTLNEFGTNVEVTDRLAKKLRVIARESGLEPSGLPKQGETLKVPERSFIRSTFDAEAPEIAGKSDELVAQVITGEKDAYTALREVGQQMQERIIERVASGEGLSPNDPLTVQIKGHDRPLIGKTGVLETTKGIRVRVVRK